MTSVPISPRLLKAGLVLIDPRSSAVRRVITLQYNPAALRVRSVQEGSFMRQGGIAVSFTQQVDPAGGRVDIAIARNADSTGASGSGLLAAVLFDAIAEGSATFSSSGAAVTPSGDQVPLQFSPVTVTVR